MAADPYTAFFGGVGQGVGKGLGNAMSDTGVTSNTASAATYGTQLGGGGWNINFGGGDIASESANRQVGAPPVEGNPLGTWSTGVGGGNSTLLAVVGVLVIVGAAVAYRMRKGRR